MSRRRAARRDPDDRLAAAHAHLVTAVEALTSGAEWRRMLEVAARFPTYSARNVLLIGAQAPSATRVMGIRSWNSLGRRVRKGEKGIAILAPCLYQPRDRYDTDRQQHPPKPATNRPPGTEPARELRGFRVVYVFDIAATEGEPLPNLDPTELVGAAPRELVQRLTAALTGDGYAVEYGPCGAAYGYTDFRHRTVRVRDDVAERQVAKTLAHELGHVRAGHEHRFLDTYASSRDCRAEAEVEAESIAYVVTTTAGMATDAYSVPYLGGWSGGDTDLIRATATRVLDTARGIVRDLGLAPPDLAAPGHVTRAVPTADRLHQPGHDPLGR